MLEKHTELTEVQREELSTKLEKARKAQKEIENYDQEKVDKLVQAVAWSVANKQAFEKLTNMGIEESKLGDYNSRINKRGKIKGILRDALRGKSVGVIEEIPEKGITKYGKPVGLIASIVPTTNPALTPGGTGVYAIKARDVVIFAPHPRSKKTTFETVKFMREALKKEGVPEDVFQCLENVSIPMTQALMAESDLVLATGGPGMVQAAYSSGTPAYGVGSGNSTVVVDETADLADAAEKIFKGKTFDHATSCSSENSIVVQAGIYDKLMAELKKFGGYVCSPEEKEKLKATLWPDGHTLNRKIVAQAPEKIADAAGISIPGGTRFIMVEAAKVGPEEPFA